MLVYWVFSYRRHKKDFASLPRAFALAGVAFDVVLLAAQILNASGFFQTPAAMSRVVRDLGSASRFISARCALNRTPCFDSLKISIWE